MKAIDEYHGSIVTFLSDLCGREESSYSSSNALSFLSDLCGREVFSWAWLCQADFLSDLCGREEDQS